MSDRVLDLARAGLSDDKIAAVLTGEGHRSPTCGEEILPITVQRLDPRSRPAQRSGAGLKAEHPGELAPRLSASFLTKGWTTTDARANRLLPFEAFSSRSPTRSGAA